MTPIDLWAAVAAFVAGSSVAIRARMLRPRQRAWTHAPAPVWVGLSALALGQLMAAFSIWFGGHATAREAMVYSLLAVVGVVMLLNLNRHGRIAEVEREAIERRVRVALEASGEPARYPHERSNG